MGNIQG